MAMLGWLTGLLSAISLKLTSSIDDVVWLAPFLTSNVSSAVRVQNAVIYITVCLVQTLVAMTIAYSGNSLLAWLLKGKEGAWSSDKILTVFAGSLLAIYGIKLTIELIQEMREGGEENGEAAQYDKVATTEEGESRPEGSLSNRGKDKQPREIEMADQLDAQGNTTAGESPTQPLTDEDKDKARQQTLFVIAFIGSVDDLTLFVPMLVGKAFDLAQLMLGAFISASAIVLVCIFIGLCKPIADCLSNIPLALIVAIFATALLSKGLTMS